MDMIQIDNQNENALFEAVPGGSPYNLAMAAGRQGVKVGYVTPISCLLYTSPSPRDVEESRMPSSA